MSDFRMKFGFRLKALRISRGLTQEQLAERLDVSKDTVRNYERGRYGPEFNRLPFIAAALTVTICELFRFD